MAEPAGVQERQLGRAFGRCFVQPHPTGGTYRRSWGHINVPPVFGNMPPNVPPDCVDGHGLAWMAMDS